MLRLLHSDRYPIGAAVPLRLKGFRLGSECQAEGLCIGDDFPALRGQGSETKSKREKTMKKLAFLSAVAVLTVGLTSGANASVLTCEPSTEGRSLITKDGADIGQVNWDCMSSSLIVYISTTPGDADGRTGLFIRQTTVDLSGNDPNCDALRNKNDNPLIGFGDPTSTLLSSRGAEEQLHVHSLALPGVPTGSSLCVVIDANLFDAAEDRRGRPFVKGGVEFFDFGGKSGHDFLIVTIVYAG